ncbi:MAG: hypothetical protein BWY54_00849 [Candidatus Dependentiae bacterium ADurb.Bin331]|nr:MAG: hypothetical protein BWY54_00849 [Candidatus Dependentiae bacterium ADurb.Bin331]
MKKKLLFIFLLTLSSLLNAVAVKLPIGKRVAVSRFETVYELFAQMQAQQPEMLKQLYALVKNCRKKTKCYINFAADASIFQFVKERTENEFTLWNEDGVIHPDVRNIMLTVCKELPDGTFGVLYPFTPKN